jgi:segregation and condensation protein A
VALDLAGRPRFAVHLDVYTGPLDLLLALIERHELDITVVSLLTVTDQFLAYLDAHAVDLDEIAAYLVVAAKLLLLKSVRLLPPAPAAREDDGEPSPVETAAALARQLRDYRRIKAAAAALRQRDEAGWRSWPRRVPPAVALPRRLAVRLSAEGLRDLLLGSARRRPPTADLAPPPRRTVAEQIEAVRRLLPRHGATSFRTIVGAQPTVEILVATFLALLELARRGEIELEQQRPFGDITLRRAATPRAPSPGASAGHEPAASPETRRTDR